jgi:hypothetical protein
MLKPSIKYFFWLILFLILFFKAYVSMDPDFGWRLTTGFRILTSGVPKIDIYTYSMPSFPWIDHAWLTDAVIAVIYTSFGYVGLSFFFAGLTVSAIYISNLTIAPVIKNILRSRIGKANINIDFVSLPFLIFASASIFRFSGIRVQVITWIFMALLLRIIFDEELWKKLKKFVPLMFLIWANFHGGFLAGIATLTVFVILYMQKSKKINWPELFILFLSISATLINPYGIHVYREIFSSITDRNLSARVMEWNSFFTSFSLAPMFLITLSAVLMYKFRNGFGSVKIILYFLFLYEGLTSVRQMPLFVLLVLPLGVFGYYLFVGSLNENKEALERFNKINKGLIAISMIVFVIEAAISVKASLALSERNFYPRSAITFLKENSVAGNIFSDYGWGGYLIWKLPQKKVFIDGRMPSWHWDKNIEGETNDAMSDYTRIVQGDEDYGKIFDKFSINTVLWHKKPVKGPIDRFEDKYFDQLDPIYKLLGKKHSKFDFSEKLKSDGWKVVYSDDVSIILQK